MLWKAQIVPYLEGQHLYGLFDETTAPPSQTITVESNNETQVLQNLEFQHEHLQNQMILNAIIPSFSERILTHVVKQWQMISKTKAPPKFLKKIKEILFFGIILNNLVFFK